MGGNQGNNFIRTHLKIGAVLTLMLYITSSEGSCLSYGHSCWGAHGKRNALRPQSGINFPGETRWFLSRLEASAMRPQGLTPPEWPRRGALSENRDREESPLTQRTENINQVPTENLGFSENGDNSQEVLVMANEPQQAYRLYQLMDSEDGKLLNK